MRRLWITRHKAAAARFAKMKVYMEDPENGDTDINGHLCRKLGELKNDQQKHFAIGSDEAKIFVVADKRSRNLRNGFVRIPEGEDDVFLAGRNYRKPGAGTYFRFDGVTEETVGKNRAAGRRKGRGLLITAIIVGILVCVLAGAAVSKAMPGNAPTTVEPQTFACRDLQITLTEEFLQTDANGYTACYSAGDTAVFLLREEFAAMEGFAELSLEDYGSRILANNGLAETVTLEEENGLTTFDWVTTDPETGTAFYYYCGLYKGPDAFWMVQVTAVEEKAAQALPQFRQWLESVTVSA